MKRIFTVSGILLLCAACEAVGYIMLTENELPLKARYFGREGMGATFSLVFYKCR